MWWVWPRYSDWRLWPDWPWQGRSPTIAELESHDLGAHWRHPVVHVPPGPSACSAIQSTAEPIDEPVTPIPTSDQTAEMELGHAASEERRRVYGRGAAAARCLNLRDLTRTHPTGEPTVGDDFPGTSWRFSAETEPARGTQCPDFSHVDVAVGSTQTIPRISKRGRPRSGRPLSFVIRSEKRMKCQLTGTVMESDSVPSSNRVRVAVVKLTSTIFGVHWLLGHVGVAGSGSGSSVVTVNRY